MQKSTYKKHPHFDSYLISDSGEIFSTISKKILRQKTRRDNYKEVVLRKGGKSYSCLVHKLVLEAHVGIPQDFKLYFTVCNHIDGNRGNNNLSNLEWTTQKDNCSEEKSNQKTLSQNARGIKIARADDDGKILNVYPSINEAARDNDTCHATLTRAIRLDIKYKGYYWKYAEDHS